MKITAPDYYASFACLCGDCPDPCCVGWEVVVDEKSLQKYQNLPGALGDKIRSVMQVTDGEPNFRLQSGGRCPFLMESGLCQMQAALGEDILCRTCRLFPRILWESGDRREISLSLSCPEAARLILTHEGTIRFSQWETDEPITCFHDLDADWYLFLLDMRARLLSMAQDRTLPLSQRMARCLMMAASVQKAIRQGEDEQAALTTFENAPLTASPHPSLAEDTMQRLLSALFSMERFTGRWDDMLSLMKTPPSHTWDAPDTEYENIFVYYLFRYFMDAVFDGNVYLPVRIAFVCVCLIRRLFRCQPTPPSLSERIDLAHLFSREIEHSDDNMDMLRTALLRFPLSTLRHLCPLVI